MIPVEVRVLDAEPPCVDTVAKLEEVLKEARAGRLSSVAIAVVYRNGSSGAFWSKAPSLSCLIGAIVRLQYEIVEFASA